MNFPEDAVPVRALPAVPWGSDQATLARQFGDQVAVVLADGGCATYDELMQHASTLAASLRQMGIASGEPVATCLRNSIPAVWASYGVIASGGAETALDPRLGESDLTWCLTLADVKAVVTSRERAAFFNRQGVRVIAVEEVHPAEGVCDIPPPVSGSAIGKIVFTSGTTGRPKAVLHTHYGRWVANLLLRAHLPNRPTAADRILLVTPFTHGASLLTYAYLDHGASIALLDGVDTDTIRQMLDRDEVTAIFAPPTVLAKLVATLEGRRYRKLTTIFCGTATLQPDLYAAAREIFGPVIRVTYGKSEVFNPITVLAPAECDKYYSNEAGFLTGICLGWPANGVEIRIADRPMGEILVRSPHMLTGLISSDGFDAAKTEDGFHNTGDIGYVDGQGRLFLTGRAKDAIKTGGYKVYPEEIERVFERETAVVGYPSDYWGEVIIAVAEGVDSSQWLSEGRRVAEQLTDYKRPRGFLTLQELPRSAQGKLQRSRIREMLLEHYQIIDGPHPRFVAVDNQSSD